MQATLEHGYARQHWPEQKRMSRLEVPALTIGLFPGLLYNVTSAANGKISREAVTGEGDICVGRLLQTISEAGDLDSYFCSLLRLMPMASIDPSLAIGFYCRTSGLSLVRGMQALTAL